MLKTRESLSLGARKSLRRLVYNNETVQAKAIRQVWYDIVKFTDSNVEATELKDIADIAKVNARAIELVIGRRR